MLALLGRLAEDGPLVLVLEDAHWADASTRDLLRFPRNLSAEPVLLVVTYRTDDTPRGHPLRGLVAELVRTHAARTIALAPFTRPETGQLLAGLLGDVPERPLLDAVFAGSAGNAFLAEELAAAGGSASLTLRELLLVRLEPLPEESRTVLRALAAAGRPAGEPLLGAVTGLPEPALHAALRGALERETIVIRDDAYAFRHGLLRDAVYAELLPGERASLHAAYGRALGDPAELAHHWDAAGDRERALVAHVEAAELMERRYGFGEAARHYQDALALWDVMPMPSTSPAARGRRCCAARLRPPTSTATTRGAAELVRAAVELEPSGVLDERLGRFLWAAGDSRAALTAYERAVELVPATPSPQRARVLAARGQALMLTARHRESRACCEEAIAIAEATGARAAAGHALNTLGVDLAYLGEPDAAVARLEEARAIAEEAGDLDDLARAHLNLADVLAGALDRPTDAVDQARRGAELCRRVGLARDYGVSLQAVAAAALYALGRWDDADAVLVEAEAAHPTEMASVDVLHSRAALLVSRGEPAEDVLARSRALTANTVDPQYNAPLCAREAELALWRGEPEIGLAAVGEGLAHLEGSDNDWLAAPLLWLGAWAEADARGAGALRDELRRRANAIFAPNPSTAAYVAICRAELARAERCEDAVTYEGAAAEWVRLGRPYLAAWAGWRAAEAHLLARRGQAGEAALRRAHDVARELGARPLATELERLARRARIALDPAAAPAEPAPARFGLTLPRELEVLALVAHGHTNREFAGALFITEKTAGLHVSNVLRKLSVRSRVEAATAAHRLGLLTSDGG